MSSDYPFMMDSFSKQNSFMTLTSRFLFSFDTKKNLDDLKLSAIPLARTLGSLSTSTMTLHNDTQHNGTPKKHNNTFSIKCHYVE